MTGCGICRACGKRSAFPSAPWKTPWVSHSPHSLDYGLFWVSTKTGQVRREAISEALNQVSGQIVDAAVAVHRALGPGLLESVYEACLTYELEKRDLAVRRQVDLPVVYDGMRLEAGFRLDLLVESSVVVELKTVDVVLPVHLAQVLTYLKLSGHRLGLLMNFNVPAMRSGIHRLVL